MIEKKNFFFTVQLLRSKNDFSGGKAPEKINLGNNCHPSVHVPCSKFSMHPILDLVRISLTLTFGCMHPIAESLPPILDIFTKFQIPQLNPIKPNFRCLHRVLNILHSSLDVYTEFIILYIQFWVLTPSSNFQTPNFGY